MQMTDKQSKVKTKSPNRKLWLVSIMLILGIGILVALYINFQLTYKVDDINQKISKLGSNQKRISELSKTSAPIKKDIASTKETISTKPKEEGTLSDPYLALYDFIHNFYKVKSSAEKGNDFTPQLLVLKSYIIHSDELKQRLDKLIDLAPHNKPVNYFKAAFKDIVITLYQQPNNSNFLDIHHYVFIRPIGERAIENGGLDKQVVLIEQALMENDLQKAENHLNDLPKDIKSLNQFKLNIKNQLIIHDELIKVEEILLNKQNKNMVSK
jgi:hypothetical protein